MFFKYHKLNSLRGGGGETKEIKNIISSFTRLKYIIYSIEEKCQTPKTPGGQTHVQLHEKKTVASLKFKTVLH